MTAPLSDFMTKLMDESLKCQTEGSSGNLFDGDECPTVVSNASTIRSDVPDGDSTTSTVPPLLNNTGHSTPSAASMPSISEEFEDTKSSKTRSMEFNASLTNFMTQLLNDSEIDKLIQQGEAPTSTQEENETREGAPVLSKGAINVLTGAMHAMQRESERSNKLGPDPDDNTADLADGESLAMKIKKRRASRKKHNATKPQRPPPSEDSVASAKDTKSALEAAKRAAKEFWGSIEKVDAGDTADPYLLVKAVAPRAGYRDLSQSLDIRKMMQKCNSETSMSLISNNQQDLHKSSSQALNISGLRQQLKKSASWGHLRAAMTRIKSQSSIYDASMDIDIDSHHDDDNGTEAKNNESKKLVDDDCKPYDSARTLDASIDSDIKKRRPRSNTPRSHKEKSTSPKKRSTSVTLKKDKSSTADESNKLRSSSERRGRTSGSRRTSSKSKETRRTSTSKRENPRSSSASVRSPSIVRTPKQRSVSATPRAKSKDKSRRRSRRISATEMKDGSMKDNLMKDSSMKDLSMKDNSMRDLSRKRDKSRTRTRRGMDESSKREGSTRRARRTSTKPGESPKPSRKSPSSRGHRTSSTQETTMLKTPSTRSKRTSGRSPSVPKTSKQSSSKDTPRTSKTLRTPKTPSSEKRKAKPASRSKSFDPSVMEPAIPPKPQMRRTKTTDQLVPTMAAVGRRNSITSKVDPEHITAAPAMPPVRRRNSMTNKAEPHMDPSKVPVHRRNSLTCKGGESTAEPPKTPKAAPFRRVSTVGHGQESQSTAALTITPSERRRNTLATAGLPSTSAARRNQTKDGTTKESRVSRRNGVAAAKAPPRQKSDPVPTIQRAAFLASEAALAAKEMERRRARSRSGDGKRKTNGGMDGSHQHQASKPTNRRGTRQRSNQQAQQVLRNALNEEVKAKENAEAPIDPLAETPEGVKEAAWISRRKSRIIMAQQSHPPISSGAGV